MSLRTLLAALFFFSGFSALAYQVVWQRVLTQEIGVDSVSIAFIVAIFLFGIGIGSYAHRLVNALELRRKRTLYVGIELAIGLFGLFSTDILRAANQAALFGPTIGAQFTLNLLLLLPVTLFMGLTTPLILDLVRSRDENTGRTIGLFYGVNILGASLGAIVSGLFLIELFGLRGVTLLCSIINFLLALGFWLSLRTVSVEAHHVVPDVQASDAGARAFIAAAFILGFASMALQMVYFRTAFNHFQIYSFIFPFMLGTFLLSMAVGQFVFGQVADRAPESARGMILSIATVLLAASLLAIYRLPIHLFQPTSLDNYWIYFLSFSLCFAAPIAISSGIFTLLVRYSTLQGYMVGLQFGKMMAAVSVGNVLGAFAAPLYLFQLIGTIGTLTLTVFAYVVGALMLLLLAMKGRHLVPASLSVVALVLMALLPQEYFDQNLMLNTRAPSVLTVEDDVGIVSTFEYDNRNAKSIQVFRSPTSTVFYGGDSRGYNMAPLESLMSHNESANMLIIGLGGANYLPHLVSNPKINEITVVELSAAVIDQVYKQGTAAIQAAMDSPKVTILNDDGRRFVLAAARAGKKYDIVQNGVFQPWMSGAGNLYTVELAHKVRDILKPKGVYFTLDLELISVSAGPAFPFAYSAPPEDRYLYFVADDNPHDYPGLCRRDISTADQPLNTDDRPITEYWMLGMFKSDIKTTLREQVKYYKHPCKSPLATVAVSNSED